MHEQEHDNYDHQNNERHLEREPEPAPRIYVASLADYNEGRLHGAWIDANQSEEELQAAVGEMLDNSPSPGAEEWAIHDYEGFGDLRLDEFTSLALVAKLAAGIVRHGPAFAAWAQSVGSDAEELEAFEDAYIGEWPSGAAFAEETVDDLGLLEPWLAQVPEHLRGYLHFDYDAYFRDLVAGGAILVVEKAGGGLYVFWNE